MSEWKTIDSAPHGTTILTWCGNEPGVIAPVPIVAQLRLRQTLGGGAMRHEWVGFADGVRVIHKPTHWQPLPEPPHE